MFRLRTYGPTMAMIVLTPAMVVPGTCAGADESTVVVKVVCDISAVEVAHEGQTRIVRFSEIASEEELRTGLASGDSTGVSKKDLTRFLNNRELILNFLRGLMPPGTATEAPFNAAGIGGQMGRQYRFPCGIEQRDVHRFGQHDSQPQTAVPAPRYWHALLLSSEDIDEMAPEFYAAQCAFGAREGGAGL